MSDSHKAFQSAVESAIDDFVITELMDKIDALVRKHQIDDADVPTILGRVRDLDGLDEAWLEYTE